MSKKRNRNKNGWVNRLKKKSIVRLMGIAAIVAIIVITMSAGCVSGKELPGIEDSVMVDDLEITLYSANVREGNLEVHLGMSNAGDEIVNVSTYGPYGTPCVGIVDKGVSYSPSIIEAVPPRPTDIKPGEGGYIWAEFGSYTPTTKAKLNVELYVDGQKESAQFKLTKAEKPTETSTPEKGAPGFEAIFAVAGLLAVTYLLRRRK